MDLDRKDFVLLNALQQDASQRLEDLGRLVKLSPSSVHERLQRLQRERILRKWTIEVDLAALGLGVLALVGVRATKPCSELIEHLRRIPAITECHSVAGVLSMMLTVRVASTDRLLEVTECLRQIPGIEETQSTIVLKTQLSRPVTLSVPAPEKDSKR